MDPNNFIKVYDNALPKEVCTNAIRLFRGRRTRCLG